MDSGPKITLFPPRPWETTVTVWVLDTPEDTPGKESSWFLLLPLVVFDGRLGGTTRRLEVSGSR